MKDYLDVSYRFTLLVATLLIIGCTGPQHTYPAGDFPGSGLPSPREIISMDTSWEREFGQVQGVKASGLVFVSGQVSVDEKGILVGKGSLETQMRQAYANVVKVLHPVNLTMNDAGGNALRHGHATGAHHRSKNPARGLWRSACRGEYIAPSATSCLRRCHDRDPGHCEGGNDSLATFGRIIG